MTNTGLISESTGSIYKRVENRRSDCSDKTGTFPNIEKQR